MAAFLVPNHTDLLPTAAGAGNRAPSRWREAWGVAGSYSPLVLPLVAALDARATWTHLGGRGVAYAGLACAALGLGLMLWTLTSDCFAAILRVVGAPSRGPRRTPVGGAYAFVRHPGYVGLLLLDLGLPLMLGSWIALAAAAPFVVATLLHTHWDDLFLRRELPGYAAYARATPYRILPYIW
jgi:protein-S-isoprenylcysteine O-methyltransferase Ste14